MKRTVTLLLVVVMCISLLGSVGMAEAKPVFSVECGDAKLAPGESFEVTVGMKNSPGITSAKLEVLFDDSILVLDSAKMNAELGGIVSQSESKLSGFTLNWVNAIENVSGDCAIATLGFTVKAGVTDVEGKTISLSYDADDVFNTAYQNVEFDTAALEYLVCEHEYGPEFITDINLVTPGNCVDKAVYYYSCAKCGDSEGNPGHTFTGAIDPNNHKSPSTTVYEATYSKQGCTHFACSACGFTRDYDFTPILPKLTISGETSAKVGDKLSIATSLSNPPDGYKIVWSVSGASYKANGGTCTVTCDKAGTVTVTAKLVDSAGKDIERGTPSATLRITVEKNAEPDPSPSFFQKLINSILGIFKNIFFCC